MQDKAVRLELLEETTKLKGLVERLETLPPDGFLQKFQSLYNELARLHLLPLAEQQTEQWLEEAIRSVLLAVATLAKKFDGGPGRRCVRGKPNALQKP